MSTKKVAPRFEQRVRLKSYLCPPFCYTPKRVTLRREISQSGKSPRGITLYPIHVDDPSIRRIEHAVQKVNHEKIPGWLKHRIIRFYPRGACWIGKSSNRPFRSPWL